MFEVLGLGCRVCGLGVRMDPQAGGLGFRVQVPFLQNRISDPPEPNPRGRPGSHQQPEVNYLPRFSPQLISLERYTLSVYLAGEIDLFENLDIVHIRLLVEVRDTVVEAMVQEKDATFPSNPHFV